jgi:glycosyltransferase involved in cell wall biosynthesis
MIRRLAALMVLTASYATALAVSRLARAVRRTRVGPIRGIALVGRFDNPGWFRAHMMPLRLAGPKDIVVVADDDLPAEPPVRVSRPPAWLRPLGRGASKLAWLFVTALRCRPDLFVGFHIFPGALSALVVARLFGRPACYQMTGGEIEVADGGVQAENSLMASLGRRSALVERLALALVREFDLVIVRGGKAERFLEAHGITRNVTINTASVPDVTGVAHRPYDVVFVGRIAAIKQPEQFVEILSRVARGLPGIRAVIVGDGPLLPDIRALIAARGLQETIVLAGQRPDATALVAAAKIFVLTSRSEGMPIAAAEAMAAGAVPVSADVGELADLVSDGVSGYLVRPNDLDAFENRVGTLLRDESLRTKMSQAARDAARRHMSVETVAARWRKDLARLAGEPAVVERFEARPEAPRRAGAVRSPQ